MKRVTKRIINYKNKSKKQKYRLFKIWLPVLLTFTESYNSKVSGLLLDWSQIIYNSNDT